MTEALPAHSTGGASRDDEGATATRDRAKWLCLAATPTFAVMALLTGLGGSPMDGLCSSGHGATLSGMVTMYLLMSAFHSPPWLNLLRPARPQSDDAEFDFSMAWVRRRMPQRIHTRVEPRLLETLRTAVDVSSK
jgi:hypothetical protein